MLVIVALHVADLGANDSYCKIFWENRHKGDQLNDCLVSIDTLDCLVPYHGRKFKTHKWKFGSALRYEVAVSILPGDCVWISGPYEPGIWNDITIFRNGLKSLLGAGERVEADDGYVGESPECVKCPKSMGHHPACEEMQSIVRRRHETINKRFKQWNVLKACFRGEIADHGLYFRFCAIVTQLAIKNGEPLFRVEYEDPDFDNLYFEDDNIDDDDDEE